MKPCILAVFRCFTNALSAHSNLPSVSEPFPNVAAQRVIRLAAGDRIELGSVAVIMPGKFPPVTARRYSERILKARVPTEREEAW